MTTPNEYRKPINYRRWARLFFRLSLIALIVASCTQSIAWFGNVGMTSGRRYKPSYYYNNDNHYYQRSSTRYEPTDEIEDVSEDVAYPDYNRPYTNGDY